VPHWVNCFCVMEQVFPAPASADHKYRIVENMLTSDGVRTRLTNYTFPTLTLAREWIKMKEVTGT
jgi:hypothetical protein